MSGYPPPGGFNSPAYPGAPGSAYGAQGYPQPTSAMPTAGYGAPPTAGFVVGGPGTPPAGSYGAPQPGAYGPPQPGAYGAPQPGAYGAPQPGAYGAPQPGAYGAPQPGAYCPPQAGAYGAPQPGGYGVPAAPGYGAPVAAGYGAPPAAGYGTPPAGAYGAPPGPAYGAPAAGYGAPPSTGYSAGFGQSYPGKPQSFQPTLRPAANSNPVQDADELRRAMRGLGTDEKRIIDILSKRSASQRKEISDKYKASFGKPLAESLKKELTGNFEDVILASLMDFAHLQAKACYDAMKGAGTRETTLIQVFVASTNAELKDIKAAYKELYNRSLEKDVCDETSGDFQRILVCLLQGSREELRPADMNQAAADADELYRSGEGRAGTEESSFNRILSQRSFEHINQVANIYAGKHGRSLEKAILKETSGCYEDTLVAIVKFAQDRCGLLAEWLHNTMSGPGTRDKDLIRLVLTRSEIDLEEIKKVYANRYNKTLAKAIEGDTYGDYKRFLLAVVGY